MSDSIPSIARRIQSELWQHAYKTLLQNPHIRKCIAFHSMSWTYILECAGEEYYKLTYWNGLEIERQRYYPLSVSPSPSSVSRASSA